MELITPCGWRKFHNDQCSLQGSICCEESSPFPSTNQAALAQCLFSITLEFSMHFVDGMAWRAKSLSRMMRMSKAQDVYDLCTHRPSKNSVRLIRIPETC
ncbi:hypothetical protein AVEN_3444-1 [Araneus ventricosus]|uniref:Uncharacterized protein n=1 Tax=Araneus ventricosus TaxID=182803 RepID=A0A4Y2KD29_ARAVE|nr:hypothetical protein AVEN_3444-1 [Araneus ventricosus]